jgi:alkanesulfonate monooxygenase SsuD/methylene tetrahydromethanopterin reductase-like flavin-dependent oxidoreductase (luciferase family)
MDIDIGIFDHMDRGNRPAREVFESRVRQVQRYDEAGFYAYHVAEHHGTPLSVLPSPNVFLGAVAHLTKRLRFGPLVYVLPLYQPLRLIEEICMLDQMSGGRLEFGVGRGIVPFELMLFDVNPHEAMEIYKETLDLVRLGLSSPSLTFAGRYYKFFNVALAMEPVQKPHPPLWYAMHFGPETAVWPARNNANVAMLASSAAARPMVDRYLTEWHGAHDGSGKAIPKIGITRSIVIAERASTAVERARRAYGDYMNSLATIWRRYGSVPHHFPYDLEEARRSEGVVCGTRAEVRAELERQVTESGANYLIARFAFGDMTVEEAEESTELFIADIMPHLQMGRGAR